MKQKEIPFTGFTPETFQFFKDLKDNNYKEWFDAHKHIYENDIIIPLRSLVGALAPTMHNIDPEFELRPTKVVSRIYRDVRFSKNKDPYKTCMWISFQVAVSREEWVGQPGYFMEITSDDYTLGMGLYQPKKKVMDNFRDEISYKMEEFEKETQQNILDKGFVIGGNEYKRPLINDLPEYFQPWIQRKGVWTYRKEAIGKDFFSDKLINKLEEDFKSLAWLYHFMKETASL